MKDLKITLRAARVNAGLKLVDAAKEFGINKDTLAKYEKDSTNIPRSLLIKIEGAYGWPAENIFFGQQSEFFRKIKSA